MLRGFLALGSNQQRVLICVLCIYPWFRSQRRCDRDGRGRTTFDACLRLVTVDHASLSRRSIVSTPKRDTSFWALIKRLSTYYTALFCVSYIAFPVRLFCGHLLSPGIENVLSLLSTAVPSVCSKYFTPLCASLSLCGYLLGMVRQVSCWTTEII